MAKLADARDLGVVTSVKGFTRFTHLHLVPTQNNRRSEKALEANMGKCIPHEEYNSNLKALALQIVENQIAGQEENGLPLAVTAPGDSNYVENTFNRLAAVHGTERAKEMIAAVLLGEMYEALKDNKPIDELRYKAELEKLGRTTGIEKSGTRRNRAGLSKEAEELL